MPKPNMHVTFEVDLHVSHFEALLRAVHHCEEDQSEDMLVEVIFKRIGSGVSRDVIERIMREVLGNVPVVILSTPEAVDHVKATARGRLAGKG